MKDLVSIVVPIYNMGNTIEKCVESLRNQEYEDIEIILVDDGSKDDSYKNCLLIAEKDKRVKAFHTENQGSGPARNYGIAQSSGRYIYFPDADDYLEPNAISKLVDAMKYEDSDLVVFGYKNIGQKNNLISIKKYDELMCEGQKLRDSYSECILQDSKLTIQGAPWNKFFDLKVIKDNNILYPPLRRHQDEGFIARYMCYAKKVHFIEDVLYTYYVNDLSKVWQKYPLNYIDAVIGLHNVWCETIKTWNSSDALTHDIVEKWFVCNVVKSCELTFAPKHNLSRKERIAYIAEFLEKSNIKEIEIPKSLGKYHKKIMVLAKKSQIKCIYRWLKFKVFLQKTKLLNFIKRI